MLSTYVPPQMFERLHFDDVLSGERLHFVVTPQTGADRWASAAGSAQGRYAEGVANTQKDVVGNAIRQQGAMVANFNQAVTSGYWARKLSEVGTAGWKQRTQAKASNYSTGVTAAKDRYAAAAAKLYPYIAQGQQMIDAMPKGSLGDAKARANAWIDYMAAYKAQA